MSRFDTTVRGTEFIAKYDEILSEDFRNTIGAVGAAGEYDELLAGLDELKKITDGLYEMDRHGGYKLVNRIPEGATESNLDKLKAAYRKVHETSEALYKKLPMTKDVIDSAYEKTGKTLADLDRIISPDIALFNTFSSDEYVSLPELMYRSGVKTYDVSDVTVTKVGGNQSSRIPLKLVDSDGRTVEGFYTKKTTYDPFPAFIEAVQKVRSIIEPAVNDKVLKAYDQFTQTTIRCKYGRLFEFLEVDPVTHEEYTLADSVYEYTDIYDMLPLSDQRTFTDVLNRLTKEFLPHYSLQDAINQSRDMVYGANIDRRNSAMSDIASLLGIRHLIAESQDVKVKDASGQILEGTFMEMAEGVPFNSVFYNGEKQFTSQAKKDLCDLQILDYLCLNVDRHIGNIFIKQGGGMEVTGIVGIDNDASFGERTGFQGKVYNCLTNISEIKYISKDLAERLVSLDEGALVSILRGRGLPETEIVATKERLKDIKELAKGALTRVNDIKDPDIEKPNHAVALDDKTFGRVSMDGFVKEAVLDDNHARKRSLFHSLKVMSNGLKGVDPKDFKPIDMTDKMASEIDTDEKTESGLKKTLCLLADYKQRLREATSFFRGSSQNYIDMQDEVDTAIETIGGILSDRSATKMNVTPEEFAACNKAVGEVLKKAGHYISEKEKETKKSSYAENRLALAKDFSDALNASALGHNFKQDAERAEMEAMNMNKISSTMLEEILKTEDAFTAYGKLENPAEKAKFIISKLPRLSSHAYAGFDDKIGKLIEDEGGQLDPNILEELKVAKTISEICKNGKEAADILSTNTEYQGERLGKGKTFKDLSECKLAYAKMKIVDNVLNSKGVGNVQKVFETYYEQYKGMGLTRSSFEGAIDKVVEASTSFKKFKAMGFKETLKVLENGNLGSRKEFISLNANLDNAFEIKKPSNPEANSSVLVKSTRLK